MPISGVVITVKANHKQQVLADMTEVPGIEVHGDDDKGHIVAVLETESSEEMEALIDRIAKDENVLNVGLTYLNTEDEAEKMARGDKISKPFGFRKPT